MLRDTGIWTLGSTVIRCTLLLLPHTPCVIAVAGRRKERREEGAAEQGAPGGGAGSAAPRGGSRTPEGEAPERPSRREPPHG
jgi:hypothetical protein